MFGIQGSLRVSKHTPLLAESHRIPGQALEKPRRRYRPLGSFAAGCLDKPQVSLPANIGVVQHKPDENHVGACSLDNGLPRGFQGLNWPFWGPEEVMNSGKGEFPCPTVLRGSYFSLTLSLPELNSRAWFNNTCESCVPHRQRRPQHIAALSTFPTVLGPAESGLIHAQQPS